MVETATGRAVNAAGDLVRGATKRFMSLQDEKESSAKEEKNTLANRREMVQ